MEVYPFLGTPDMVHSKSPQQPTTGYELTVVTVDVEVVFEEAEVELIEVATLAARTVVLLVMAVDNAVVVLFPALPSKPPCCMRIKSAPTKITAIPMPEIIRILLNLLLPCAPPVTDPSPDWPCAPP